VGCAGPWGARGRRERGNGIGKRATRKRGLQPLGFICKQSGGMHRHPRPPFAKLCRRVVSVFVHDRVVLQAIRNPRPRRSDATRARPRSRTEFAESGSAALQSQSNSDCTVHPLQCHVIPSSRTKLQPACDRWHAASPHTLSVARRAASPASILAVPDPHCSRRLRYRPPG
jgi:hypothetical protein